MNNFFKLIPYQSILKPSIIGWIFLICALAISITLLWHTQTFSQITTAQKHYPDAYMRDVAATRFDATGHIESLIFTPELIHYSDNDTTDFINPKMQFYPRKGQPWDITAEMGRTTHEADIVYLWNNVYLHEPPGTDNQDALLITSFLKVIPQKSYADTSQAVTGIQPGTLISAMGMQAYFKDSRVILLNQARGHYVATSHS